MSFDIIDPEGRLLVEGQDGPTIRAIILYNNFNTDTDSRTIADIVWGADRTLADYLEGLPEEHNWVVYANEKTHPRESWGEIKLDIGDTIIVSLVPQGPVFALIPILVASALPAAIISTTLVTIISTIIEIGLVIAGGLLVQTLMGGAKTPQAQQSGSNYSITGPFNTAQEGTVIPKVYGTFRMAGNVANTYVDNGNDVSSQVLYVQYIIGEGEVDSISDVQINYQPIANFVRASWDWRAGTIGQAPMPWFANQISPITVLSKITTIPAYYTTQTAIDRFRLDFQFPNGLYQVASNGDLEPYYCELIIKYRTNLNGAGVTVGPWVSLAQGPAWFLASPTPIAIGSAILNTNGYCSGLRITVQITGSNTSPTTPYNAAVQYRTSAVVPTNTSVISGNISPYQWRVGGTGTTLGQFVNLGSEVGNIINTPIINPDGTLSYIPGVITRTYEVNNLAISTYDLQLTGCTITKTEIYTLVDLNFDTNYRGTWNVSLPSPSLAHGFYDIMYVRKTPSLGDTAHQDEAHLQTVNEITDALTVYNNTAYYGLQITLGGQLTSSPNVTALVRGTKVNIYDRNGGILGYQWSNNPADIALDVLLNARHRFAIANSRIDFAGFDNWRQFCVNNGLVFNGSFDSQTNVWDALTQVMRIGHAGPAMVGLRWSVVIEGPADPVMMFTQDNIIKSTFQNEFTGRKNRGNQIEVIYWDKDDFYKQHSAFAFDNTIGTGDALVSSSFQAIGIDNAIQAQNEAWFQLNLNRYLTQSCQFDVFLQAMGAAVGDVVIVQHDMPAWGASARITAVNGLNITIDQPIPSNGALDWRMMLMQPAQCFATMPVTAISGNQLMLGAVSAPAAPAGFPVSVNPPIGGIGNWANEIATQGGLSRIVLDGVDYGVNDQQVLGGTLRLSLDRPVVGAINDIAYLIKNDYLLQASITPPPPATDQFDQTITISGWLGDTGNPAVGDRVLLGENTLYSKPFRIQNITYKTDHVRTVKAIEYNASIYGPNPSPTGNSSTLPVVMLQVYNLLAQQSQKLLVGGALQYYANIQWTEPLNSPFGYGGAIVYAAVNNAVLSPVGNVVGSVNTFSLPLSSGDTVIFKVVAYGTANQSADASVAPVCSLTVGTSIVVPTSISLGSLLAVGSIRQIAVSWTMPTDDFVAVAEVWESLTSDLTTAYLQFSGRTNYFVRSGLNTLDTRYFWVRTKSIAGTYSAFVGPVSAQTSYLITGDLGQAIVTAAQFAQNIAPVGLFDGSIVGAPTSLSQTGGVQVVLNTADGQLYRWNGTTFTTVVPAVNVSGQLTAAQIATLTTAQLTGQIQTAQLAAGSVLTEQLGVGNPTNVIWNSCCSQTTASWFLSTTLTPAYLSVAQAGVNALPSYGSGQVLVNNTVATGGTFEVQWCPQGSSGVAVSPGINYGGAAMITCPSGVQVQACIYWLNSSGSVITTSYGSVFGGGTSGPGAQLSDYVQVSVLAVAPATSVLGIFVIRGTVTQATNMTNPFFVFSMAQFGQMPINATLIGPWAPGGVTTINGGVLETGSVTANQIAANSITAGKIAANAITAGTIAAGAISSNEIAAGTIRASMLAADFALFNSAQIGALTVNTLNIAGSAVGTGQLGTDAATTFVSATASNQTITFSVAVSQNRQALVIVTAQATFQSGAGQAATWNLSQDGVTLGGVTAGQTYGNVGYTNMSKNFAVTLSSSTSNTFVFTGSGVLATGANITVFGRIK